MPPAPAYAQRHTRRHCRRVLRSRIFLAVTQEIPRPRLAVARARATSLRLPQRTKKQREGAVCLVVAGPLGIEPRLTVLETVVLPLYDGPVRGV